MEKLIFPIGFDLAAGVEQAGKDWNDKFADKLEKKIKGRPISVKLKLDEDGMAKLDDVKTRLAGLKIEPITPATKTAIKELARELEALARALEKVSKYSVSSVGTSSVRGAKVDKYEAQAAAARELARQRAARAAAAESKLEIARLKAATAADRATASTNRANGAYQRQSSYLSNLVKKMVAYASVDMVGRFLTNVREVTAQFELQRISLGAIIQDQARANQLFSEIKQFAITSPVSIMDLTKYTKQLAAYKIGVDELFETTKKLTDVSVGLGVSMDRVVLAYGQTRATGYLRASEIRQFTEMGVPIVEELAKKLSQMNGELVTATQVMDMVSKRAISFELVKQVFDDMTSAGGMFYNMQEKQGNTLYGMWAKLGDAASIMYDEIGNTGVVNSSMKGLIELTTDLMRNWKHVGAVIATVAAGAGVVALKNKIQSINQGFRDTAVSASKKLQIAQAQLNAEIAKGTKEIVIYDGAVKEQTRAEYLRAKVVRDMAAKEYLAAQNTTIWSKAFGKLKSVISGHWVTLLLTAIALIAEKFIFASISANKLDKQLGEIQSKANMDMSGVEKKFKSLADAAVNAEDGSKRQREALEELQRTYGNVIPAQDLTIEKLREMEGHYDKLTAAIKENIAQTALQQSIDTIKEDYGNKNKKARKRLKKQLTNVVDKDTERNIFSPEQVERIISNYEAAIGRGLNAFQSLREALVLEGETYTRYTKGLLDSASGAARQFYAVQKGLVDKINSVTDAFSTQTGELGMYEKAWQKMMEFNENMTLKSKKGTFAYSQELKNAQIQNMKTFLAEVLGEAWSDSYAQIAAEIGDNADKMSELFWVRIGEAAETTAQKNAVAKAQEAYWKLIPQSEVVRVWQSKAQEIAIAQKFSMDSAQKYRIQDSEHLKDYRKRLEGDLTNILQDLTQYTVTRNQIIAAGGDTANIDNLIEFAEKQKQYVEALLALLPQFKESGTSRISDNRLSQLNEMEQTLTKINQKYEELRKKEGETKALEDIKKIYGDTLAYVNKLAGGKAFAKFGLKFDMPTDLATLNEYRDAIKKVIESLKMQGYEKAALELQTKIDTGNVDELRKQIEKQLKDIADKISRTKTAKEFYEKIFNSTGDMQLAKNIAFTIYGTNGNELKKQMAEEIKQYFHDDDKKFNIEVPLDIITKEGDVNYYKLQEFAKAMLDIGKIGPDTVDKISKAVQDGQKDFAKNIEGYIKDLEAAKTYSDKRIELARYTQQKISEIYALKDKANLELGNLLAIDNPTEEQKARIAQLQGVLGSYLDWIDGYKKREAKKVAELQYEAFKDSPMYVQVFDDLDHASTTMLRNMKQRLSDLQGQWKNLDPKQLKEMQSRLNEIDTQLARRNPFKTLADSIRDYAELRKKGTRKEADDALTKAEERRAQADAMLREAVPDSEDAKFWKQEYDAAEAAAHDAEKVVENWKKVEDMIGLSADKLFQMLNWAGDIAKGIADISEAMGADAEDVQYWNDIASALGEISGGIQDIVNAAMSVDVVGVISSIITALPKMFKGIWNLSYVKRIKNANKEIKRQEEILEELEYSYSRLEKAAEKAFGGQWIENRNKQLESMQATAEAYRKQLELEKSKGKKADKEKIKEYEKNWREALDNIADRQGEVFEKLAGSDMTSAARDFAQAWLDAYKEFGNTADAMSEKFHEMIENMVVESLLARVMQSALAPAFELIDQAQTADFYDPQWWANFNAEAKKDMAAADAGTKNVMAFLQSAGIELRSLGGELSGISKEIGGASSEEINAMTAALNTQNFYTSHLPIIAADTAAIRALLDGGASAPVATDAGWTDYQQQAMDNLNAITRNTAETAAECKRSANAAENTLAEVKRMIVYEGGSAKVRVKM